MRTEEEWARAFETSRLRADYELSVYLGTDDRNGDDEFYDDLAELSDKHYWDRLAAIERRGVRITGVMPEHEVLPPFERRQRRPLRLVARKAQGGVYRTEADALRDIDSQDYYEALTGWPAGTARVTCPNPAHEDLNPACSLDGPLWHCFACASGGSIYDMAALIWDVPFPLRGAAYGEVRDRLKEMFGVAG